MLTRLHNAYRALLNKPPIPQSHAGTTAQESPEQPNPFDVGTRGASLHGLRNANTGEFAPGFKVTKADTVLDAGCGEGWEAMFCAEAGAHLILMDIEADRVERASERLRQSAARQVDMLVGDGCPIDLPSESVTRVICREVLEHVEDPAAFMAELERVGKPEALYFLSCPAPESEHLLEGIAPDFYFQKPHHIRVLEREDFDNLVTDAGLEIENRITHGAFWTIWWMLFWVYEDGLTAPWHPLSNKLTEFWDMLQETEKGEMVSQALDRQIPRTQIIVARKKRR